MTVKAIEQVVYRKPFQPFRLLLDNGELVTVERPRKAHVSGRYVALAGISRPKRGAGRKGLRIIPTDRIVSVEDAGIAGR